jgi:hypothetical protein
VTRSKAQREQDRADLLAVLTDAGEPMWGDHLVAAAYGRRPGQYPTQVQATRGYSDLRALERAGLVVREHRSSSYSVRWSLVTAGALTRRDHDDDVDDLRRQMAAWEPADQEDAS